MATDSDSLRAWEIEIHATVPPGVGSWPRSGRFFEGFFHVYLYFSVLLKQMNNEKTHDKTCLQVKMYFTCCKVPISWYSRNFNFLWDTISISWYSRNFNFLWDTISISGTVGFQLPFRCNFNFLVQ